ncbi:saccharopine dehydrogenase family protein [Litoribacillus peritrichatus]|uniref:Saccharopine dehydrogenase NADP-binding domain-containing protein n=1 Tax=Litoribacillus peritrichatus TaxID=718191 RepID=A0ABP7N807_9GAMM
MTPRVYDIVIFGATGFTGQLTVQYLSQKLVDGTFSLAIAGRNFNKLHTLKNELVAIDRGNEVIGVEVADVADEASMMALAAKTRVLITTVGPYTEFGEAAIKACAEKGTDYLDLTGELEFVERMYAKYDMVARSTKCRLIHCCGFDSIPHDLGVLFAVQQLSEEAGELVRSDVFVDGYVKVGGRISGGTWHTMINAFSRLAKNLDVVKFWRSLTQGKDVDGRRIRAAKPQLKYDYTLRSWVVSLPTIDGQVVRRSAELFEQYGRRFTYGHYLQIRRLPKLLMTLGGFSSVIALSQFKWTRNKLLELLPQGEGPTDGDRERAWFKVTIRARSGRHKVVASVRGGDPGYTETAKMLSESALALVLDNAHLEPVYGVLTPAAAMGNRLIERLDQAGIKFTLLEDY